MIEQPITDAERAELKRLRAELYHFEMSSQVNDHVLTEVREALRTPPGKSIIEHAGRLLAENERLGAALLAIQAEPYGCPFCDSGKLRNPTKGHTAECGYLKMDAALRRGAAEGAQP